MVEAFSWNVTFKVLERNNKEASSNHSMLRHFFQVQVFKQEHFIGFNLSILYDICHKYSLSKPQKILKFLRYCSLTKDLFCFLSFCKLQYFLQMGFDKWLKIIIVLISLLLYDLNLFFHMYSSYSEYPYIWKVVFNLVYICWVVKQPQPKLLHAKRRQNRTKQKTKANE